ncbi:MAG: hypothetical protein IAE79_05780 [Anaerolinea sp.]|nr:hypothetical protein [Anaerolinea sp.]
MTHILKTWKVIPGAPNEKYGESECPPEIYRNEETAMRMLDWWRFDQGRRDTELVEHCVECPVIDDLVYVPDCVM